MLDNRLHLLVRLDPDRVAWSDEEVVRRWGRPIPPRDSARQPLEVSEGWLKDAGWLTTAATDYRA